MSAALVFSGFGSNPVLQAPHLEELSVVGRGNVVVCAMLLLLHVSSPGCCLFVSLVYSARSASFEYVRLARGGFLQTIFVSITVAVCLESKELVLDWFHVSSPGCCFLCFCG